MQNYSCFFFHTPLIEKTSGGKYMKLYHKNNYILNELTTAVRQSVLEAQLSSPKVPINDLVVSICNTLKKEPYINIPHVEEVAKNLNTLATPLNIAAYILSMCTNFKIIRKDPSNVYSVISFLYSCISDSSSDMLTTENPEALMEELMTKAQLVKKYSDQIHQLPDGRYHIRCFGKQIFKKNLDDVILALQDLDKNESTNKVGEVAKMWLCYRKNEVAETTYADSLYHVEHYLYGSSLAQKKVQDVTKEDASAFFTHCNQVYKENGKGRTQNYNDTNTEDTNMKEKYWKCIRDSMSRLFDYAIDTNLTSKNPFKGFKVHQDKFAAVTYTKDSDKVFSDSERIKIKELAYEESTLHQDAVPLGIIAFFCLGIRCGELLGLKFCDLEEADGFIRIQRMFVGKIGENGKIQGQKLVPHTKSKSGYRLIPLNSEAKDLFKKIQELNAASGYGTSSDEFIFQRTYHREKCVCTPRVFDTKIASYCKQIGIQRKSLHDIRRTFATNLYYNGMNIKQLQKLMGHSTLEQTMSYIKFKSEIDSNNIMETL